MDSDIPSIYFPIGSLEDGGTCEFATLKCQEYCPSGMKSNYHERYALDYFKNNSARKVVNKLIEDFNYLIAIPYNSKMIQWYTWGDCPSELTEKVVLIILNIYRQKIPQYGFTRNIKLWEKIPKKYGLSIGLTVDSLDKAKKISLASGKMTAYPDFASGYANMIIDGKIKTKCNGWWCITDKETRNSDCSRCLSCIEGCYSIPS